ncbi:MAG: cupin domain-containing protein [Bacteroidetes bacterium]|nr:MAG: cupin domain-containing protein [Bacteroidota bacterium]
MIKKTTPLEADRVNAPIDGRIMFSNNRTESILLTLQPGEIIPSHKNPFDVLFIGLSGTATLTSEEKSMTVEPCETVFISSDEPRQMENKTSDTARIMVVKLL